MTTKDKGITALQYLGSSTGAVARSVLSKLQDTWSVFDFMSAAQITAVQSRAGSLDVTTQVQAAVTAAWKAGKRLYMPAGLYKAKIQIPYYDGVNTYQGNVFELFGDGAGNGFLGGNPYDNGTTIISPDTGMTLRYLNYLGAGTTSGNHCYIHGIRFDGTTASAVVQFDRFSDYSVFSECEIRQHGTGPGFRALHAYGGTIRNVHSMNDQLVSPPGTARTSIAFDIQSVAGLSGAILHLDKCTGRGFQIAYNLGSGNALDTISAKLSQCESSVVNYGILINAGMVNTIIDSPYFEAVEVTCIQDAGASTHVINGMFFESFLFGIDSRYDNYGSVYQNNRFQQNTVASVAVAIQSKGDAVGTKKIVEGNFFYFLGSGGAIAGVSGVQITGVNPQIELARNTFRPARAWVGGAGTTQILDSSTGYLAGSTVTADDFNSFQLLAGVGLNLSYTGTPITEASVAAGVLTLPVESSITLTASSATAVTQFNLGSGKPRIVVLVLTGTNFTLTKGTYMKMSANLAVPGSITFDLRSVAGVVTAYELARTVY